MVTQIKTQDIANLAITEDKIANSAVTEDKINKALLTLLTQMNILINGGFEIWQRGIHFNAISTNTYTVDMWKNNKGGTTQPDFNVDISDGTGGNLKRDDSKFALRINFSGSSPSGDAFAGMIQPIENYIGYIGKYISLSCWVYSTVANKIKIYIQDSAGTTFSSYHTGSGWEQLTVTRLIDSATVSLTACCFSMGAGDLTIGTYFIDNAMLIIGSQPVDYVPLSPTEEWNRCLRFYETGQIQLTGKTCSSPAQMTFPVIFKTPKSANGVLTIVQDTSNPPGGVTVWGTGGDYGASFAIFAGSGIPYLGLMGFNFILSCNGTDRSILNIWGNWIAKVE